MLLTRENGTIKIIADTYILEIVRDRPFVYLSTPDGARLLELFAPGSANTLNGQDDVTRLEAWQVDENLHEITLSLETSSPIWTKKVTRYCCTPRRLRVEMEVSGNGRLTDVHYFAGYCSAQVRWGSGFFLSGQHFAQMFNPEPNNHEVTFAPADTSFDINLTGVPLPGRGDWFFTPAPFCFAGQVPGGGWLAMGIQARPGHNRFTRYAYQGQHEAFFLSLAYEGHTAVDGRYTLPAVAFDFAPDPYTALAAHVQHLRDAGFAPAAASASHPAWWSEPIFCGWGAQCYEARMAEGKAPEFSTQEQYERFLDRLASHQLYPGTVVLDDKWQRTYGLNDVDTQKWPDLPGFIRDRHAAGQRVLLWLKAWDPEGLPDSACITNAAGLPLAVDPTGPEGERILREAVRRMLSTDGYDADGFKIDFSARIPCGPGMHAYGDAWGLELMRAYLSILHDEAHRVKPDALVITHTPHPYLADVLDAVRLNDINTDYDVVRQMTHRARVAAIACPDALIDTDNWPILDRTTWRAYLQMKPRLGIPALYYAGHFDQNGEAFTEEDYALLREVWATHREMVAAHHRAPGAAKIDKLGGTFLPGENQPVKKLALSFTLPVNTKPLKAWDPILPRSEESA